MLRTLVSSPNSGSLPPLTPPPSLRVTADPPHAENFFRNPVSFFCFWPPKRPSWRALGRSWAFLAWSCYLFLLKIAPEELRRALLADLGSIFSRFCCMFASLSPAWVSVWRRKTAQTCREPARTWRKLASSAVPPTSDSHKGAAVARSEFNSSIVV